MTAIEQAHAQLVDALRSYRTVLTTETAAVDLVLGTLDAAPQRPPRAAPDKPRKAPAKKKRTAREPQQANPPKTKSKSKKLRAPLAAHEPAKRIGRLSSKVEVKAAEDEADRKRIVEGLKADGYERAPINARLAPGLYDVIRRDGGIVVTWWPKEPEA